MTGAAPLDGLSQRLDSVTESAQDLLELLQHRLAGVTDAAIEALHTIQDVSKLWGQPHRLYGARVFWDGQQWGCLLGDPETGVAGFGRTPEHACQDFDEIWRGWPQPRGPQVRGVT